MYSWQKNFSERTHIKCIFETANYHTMNSILSPSIQNKLYFNVIRIHAVVDKAETDGEGMQLAIGGTYAEKQEVLKNP